MSSQGFDKLFKVTSQEKMLKDDLNEGEIKFVSSSLGQFIEKFEGAIFNSGEYRINVKSKMIAWGSMASKNFIPNKKFLCFANDWLSNQYCIQLKDDGCFINKVWVFDINWFESFAFDCDIDNFHYLYLLDYREQLLQNEKLRNWLSLGNPMPQVGECVGYKVPFCLGGEDEIENMEITDMEVYWELTSQIHQAVKGMKPGQKINNMTIE